MYNNFICSSDEVNHGKANVHGMREDATKPVLHRTSLMHPKTLEFLCVDELVAATVAYQLSVKSAELMFSIFLFMKRKNDNCQLNI
ncbi:hypothetical protein E2C01_034635 [Portunus trituberculatus]|uniref:Uncharacterized protein n=1 Tax=Portunus trituberculatus TaxID=210409 RepID=A0A5B7F987_PORTR|nr:hypothetical protein [Portunus trituberculatus]